MTYDQWKTTPPDWMQEADEPSPEQQEQEWFDDWFGLWLDDLADDGYVAALGRLVPLTLDAHRSN